jgi:general secretion pathway protein K
MKQPRNNKAIKGSALVFALLIVAMTSIIAYALIETSSFAIRRTQQLNTTDACSQAIHAAEIYAMHFLKREGANEAQTSDNPNPTSVGETTDLTQDWALPFALTLSKDMTLTAQITDMQGQFNLNTVNEIPPEDPYAPTLVFRRLLVLLQIPNVQVLEDSLMHWVGEDTTSADAVYLEQAQPYRPAHGFLSSISELKLITGFTEPVYNQLEPYVNALTAQAKLNVNTASATILAAILDVSLDVGQSLVMERQKYPFADTGSFLDRARARGVNPPEGTSIEEHLDVNSNYFLLKTEATCQKTQVISYSFIKRMESGIAQVYQRTANL